MRLQRHPDMPDDYRKLLSKYGPATLAGVLRLLAPDGPPGFNMATETIRYPQPHPEATLWGIFDTGETCWWFPIREHRRWFVVIVGHGKQQLNVSPTDFLLRWNNGELDLPVLSFPPVRRGWSMTPACSHRNRQSRSFGAVGIPDRSTAATHSRLARDRGQTRVWVAHRLQTPPRRVWACTPQRNLRLRAR